MAIPALSIGSYSRLRQQMAQYRAITGHDPSTQVLQAMMETEVSQAQTRSLQAEELNIRSRSEERQEESQKFQENYMTSQAATQASQFERSRALQEQSQLTQASQFQESLALQKQQLSDQAKAAKASGMIQLGETAAVGAYLLKDTAIMQGLGRTIGGMLTPAAASAATAAGLSSAAVGSTAISGGLAAEYGALGTAGMTGYGVTAAGGAGVGGAAVGTSAGLGATAGAAGLGGLVGGAVGGAVAGETGSTVGTIGGATAAGWYVGGPYGAVVGAVVGVIQVVAGGSIVCTELLRQGLVSAHLVRSATVYKKRFVDEETYQGYLRIFGPVVKKMQSSKLVTRIITPIGVCAFTEMGSRVSKRYKSTLTGKVVLGVGQGICKLVGRFL